MKVQQIKQELQEQHPKASVILFSLDEISDLNHKATFTPKAIIRRNSPIIKSVSMVINNLELLEKLRIIKITNKHTTKAMVKYTVKLNPKFQSKHIYKKKLDEMIEKQHKINEKYI